MGAKPTVLDPWRQSPVRSRRYQVADDSHASTLTAHFKFDQEDFAVGNRLKGLFRDTWWLWLLFLAIGITFIVAVSPIFFVTLPVLAVAYVYYATMRYDDNGQHKGEEH